MRMVYIPSVSGGINGKEKSTDVLSYLLARNRVVYLNGEVNDALALSVITQLQYLDAKGDGPITVVINSPGGSVSSGLAIYDCMKYGISCKVITVATGMAASMGAFLLAAGTPGHRYATPHAEIMIHQPVGGAYGQASDITVAAAHIQSTKKKLARILAEGCGQPMDKVMADCDRDYWMTAQEAMAYGLVDHVGYPNQNMEVLYED